jgi:hypothetical protein
MSFSLRSQNMLRRLLIGGRGRPMAALLLPLLLLLQLASQLPSSWLQQVPPQLAAGLAIAGAPLAEGRDWLFDSFQKLLPRRAHSQPVTIVAIDEKSLRQVGQWPWPRDRLAALIGSISTASLPCWGWISICRRQIKARRICWRHACPPVSMHWPTSCVPAR